MGHFDPKYVTHLILDTPDGSKYLNWKRHYLELYRKKQQLQQQQNSDDNDDGIQSSSAWAEKLILVTTSWVDACQREGRRVSENGFQLLSSSRISNKGGTGEDDDETSSLLVAGGLAEGKGATASSSTSPRCVNGNASKQQRQYHHHHQQQHQQHLPEEILKCAPTLEERCEYMIQSIPPADFCNLFLGQSFLLVGFDLDDELDERDVDNHDDDDDDDDDDPSDDEAGNKTHNYGGADDSSMNKMISSNGGDSGGGGDAAGGNPRDMDRCLSKKRKIHNGRHCNVAPSQDRHLSGRTSRRDRRLQLLKEKCKSLKISVSKLIRRAGGTIFWEPNEWITTVVLNDIYSKRMWYVLQ